VTAGEPTIREAPDSQVRVPRESPLPASPYSPLRGRNEYDVSSPRSEATLGEVARRAGGGSGKVGWGRFPIHHPPAVGHSRPMSRLRLLRKVGNEFLVGGLAIAAASLIAIHLDRLATGGRDSVVATCVLFLWAGAIAIGLGLVLRSIGRATARSRVSPFSAGWRPPPVVRARSRRRPVGSLPAERSR
jgi:hypothetical protein